MDYCAKQPLTSKKYSKSSKDVQGNGLPLHGFASFANLTYSCLSLIEWVQSEIKNIKVQSKTTNNK